MRVNRADVVLVDYPYSDRTGSKVRPCLVVQNNDSNQRLDDTIVVTITSRRQHASEPTELLIDISTAAGRKSGLLFSSAVQCQNILTVDCGFIRRKIGELPPGGHVANQRLPESGTGDPKNDVELRKLADALDAAVGGEIPQSHLTWAEPFLWLTANRAACFRYAANFLRAAAEPIVDGECRTKPIFVDENQIAESKKDHRLGVIQRIDQFPEDPDLIERRKRRAWRQDRVALVGCAVIALIFVALLMTGIGVWWAAFFGK